MALNIVVRFNFMYKLSGKRNEQPVPDQVSRWLRAVVSLVVIVGASIVYYLYHQKRNGNLDSFAKCISARNTKMYGLFWCPHCEDQKEMFGHAFRYVNYVECGVKGGHGETEQCKQAGVTNFPTWQFSDGSRLEGAQPLAVLSQRNGCNLP
jgi:hypothetical protein